MKLILTQKDFEESGPFRGYYIGEKDVTDYKGDIEIAPNLGSVSFSNSICTLGDIVIGKGTSIFVDGNVMSDVDITDYSGGNISSGGSIYAFGSIEADRWLEADGYIEARHEIKTHGPIRSGDYIKAGKDIISGGWIRSETRIESGMGIKASGWIRSGWDIKSAKNIETKDGIKAGWGIISGDSITSRLSITASTTIFAGISAVGKIPGAQGIITCRRLLGGATVEHGFLRETLPNRKEKL